MDTPKSTHMTMTVKQASAHYKVSDKTIRRWIKQGRVNAEQINRRWHVQIEMDTEQDSVQDTDHPDVPPSVQPPEPNTVLVDQMQSEITHLRDQLQGSDTQIDHLTQLLAMQTKQNTLLVEALDPPQPPRTPLYTRFTELVAKLNPNGWSRERAQNGNQNGTPNRNNDEHTQK